MNDVDLNATTRYNQYEAKMELDKAKQEIKDLFGYSDHLAEANSAVIELDAKHLIAYRITVDEKATPSEWLEAKKNISKYESYLQLLEVIGIK